ncbi:hypothetical protein BDY19DRAFT_591513 [Irpex rosettiformis]|uniref:Uncharacterized protein n=1 Tax=Irpex rosettiformis TaxID=378272 RepID=A0ACB8UD87_9APHY|nr:hypothetical protein BDY19DRAFT_591513 [Irpex rosettiformis]
MGEAARVYAEQLNRFSYGHALWWPEHTKGPNGRKREIDIGDVGYVDKDGAFHPLFNVTYAADDERNANRVPAGNFVVLDYHAGSVETKESFLPPGPLHSSSVSSRSIEGELAANDSVTRTAGATLSYRFECNSKEGAFLMLWDDATKTVIEEDARMFEEYMLRYHESWCEYARDKRGLSLKNEDIILVRGFVKTSRWTVAAFLGSRSSTQQVTISGELGSVVNIGINYSSHEDARCSPVAPRSGPAHPMPKDQCLFLNYYKIKRRRFFPNEIVAAADPSDHDAERRGEEDGDIEILIESEATNHRLSDPLIMILDYILEFSDAEVAITSYHDVNIINLYARTINGI